MFGIALLTVPPSHTEDTQPTGPAFVPGELLVKFRPETSVEDRASALDDLDAISRHTYRSGAEHWILGEGHEAEEAVETLEENPHVEYAELNLIGSFALEPDDDRYSEQWALPRIDAPDAWSITTGESDVVIAIIDTGIETGYLDLSVNTWHNEGEQEGDASVDDDDNGYADDVTGWDFGDDDDTPIPDQRSHATPVAGIIGAHASSFGGTGIAGINWSVQLMNLKLGLTLPISQLIEALDYAVDNGAHIVNTSLTIDCIPSCSQTLLEALQRAAERDVLVVTAAGNDVVSIDDPNEALMPASYALDNIITVAASDPNDEWAAFSVGGSNWGPTSVDVSAPGVEILTLADPCFGDPNCLPHDVDPNIAYDFFEGTSAATPHVAGVAGLIKSKTASIPYELIRLQLLDPNSLDPLSDFDPDTGDFPTVTGGRLNAHKALADYDPNAPAQISNLSIGSRTLNSIQLNWTATADDGSDPNSGPATMYQVRYSTSSINSGNWLRAKRVAGVPVPDDPNSAETTTVTGLSCNTTYYLALKGFDEWGNGPLSNVVSNSTTAPICTSSFCYAEEIKCTWSGSCGVDNCCNYSCSEDVSCLGPDTCPESACNC